MSGANFRQKNLLKDLIYLGQTKPVNKQTIKGLFRFALEPLLEAQTQKAVVLIRLFDTKELDGVLKRLEFTNAEVYSFDSVTAGENLTREDIWGDTEFLVVLSPRYSALMLWDYSTETIKDTSCLYYLLNSKEVNNVVRIISQNSKIDLMRYTQEYTPERRGNELLNKAVHKFINFADSFVEEASVSQAKTSLLEESDDIEKKYEYISSKAKTISHDIKNHLSVIDLYSKIIEKRLEMVSNKELQDSVLNAVNSIKKSKDSITNLLNELRSIQGTQLERLRRGHSRFLCRYLYGIVLQHFLWYCCRLRFLLHRKGLQGKSKGDSSPFVGMHSSVCTEFRPAGASVSPRKIYKRRYLPCKKKKIIQRWAICRMNVPAPGS